MGFPRQCTIKSHSKYQSLVQFSLCTTKQLMHGCWHCCSHVLSCLCSLHFHFLRNFLAFALGDFAEHSWLCTALLVRCPKSEIVAEQLHDQCRVFVGVLGNIIKLCDCIFKCCSGHLACFVRI